MRPTLSTLSEIFGVEAPDVDPGVVPDDGLRASILAALYEHQMLVTSNQVSLPTNSRSTPFFSS